MGKYLNTDSRGRNLPSTGKAKTLIDDGAQIVSGEQFEENLICVVENGLFDAAAYAYSESEFKVFKMDDGRSKTWLIHPDAKTLAK